MALLTVNVPLTDYSEKSMIKAMHITSNSDQFYQESFTVVYC